MARVTREVHNCTRHIYIYWQEVVDSVLSTTGSCKIMFPSVNYCCVFTCNIPCLQWKLSCVFTGPIRVENITVNHSRQRFIAINNPCPQVWVIYRPCLSITKNPPFDSLVWAHSGLPQSKQYYITTLVFSNDTFRINFQYIELQYCSFRLHHTRYY